jgi:dienelactone hydrolase
MSADAAQADLLDRTFKTGLPTADPMAHPLVSPHGLDLRRCAMAAELVVGLQWLLLMLDSDMDAASRFIAVCLVLAGGAALLVMTGRQRMAADWGVVMAGIAGITGGGVDVVHVALEGFSPANVIGLLSLASGVGLLISGAVVLLRAARGWRKLLALPVGLLVGQFILLPVSAAVYGTHLPFVAVSAVPPAGAETVSLRTADGTSLTAWYTPSRNGAALILLHGAGGTRADTAAHAAVLARHGYGLLALDARGGSAAAAPGVVWGWHGDQDIGAAVAFLQARSDVEPGRVGALGLSMGGEQAITAAASDERIRAVVAEGASVRTAADLTYLPDDLFGWVERLETSVMFGTADLMTSASQPIPLAAAVRAMHSTPLPLIAGSDPQEESANRAFVAVAPDRASLWELPDTPHIGALAWHPGEWEQRVVGFLDATL